MSGAVALAAFAPAAMAGVEHYSNQQVGAYGTVQGARHSLTHNMVEGWHANCAGARNDDGMYGHYACVTAGNAQHSYSGDHLLYPLAHDHSGATNFLSAHMWFGGDRP